MGGAGAAVGQLVGRTANQIRGIYANKAAANMVKQGGRVTPGQATGSKTLARGESVMESAGGMDAMKAQNQKVIQGQAARALGLNAGADLSETGLGRAADDIGGRMDEALNGIDNIELSDDLITKLNQVTGENPYMDLPADYKNLTGKQFAKVRRQLTDAARTEARTASPTAQKGEYISGAIDDLDAAFAEVADPAQRQQLRVAREQYRNLIAMEKGQAITPDGYVNPKTLRNNLNKQYKGARRGKTERNLPETQELMEGASTQASRDLSSVVGDSGTASRMGWGLGLPALAGGAAYAGGGESEGAITSALLAALLTKGYGRAGNLLLGAPSTLTSGAGRAFSQGLMQ